MPARTSDKNPALWVFFFAVLLCGAVSLWGLISPKGMTGFAQAFTGFAVYSLDWFFLALCTFLVIFSGWLAFGKYAHVKLGKDDDEPEFSLVSWLSMLFAAGMGVGLLFWGVAEPMIIYMDPPGAEAQSPAAARMAMLLTNLHWGIHAWSIYAVSAVSIAYFGFRKGTTNLISAPIRYAWRWKNMEFWALVIDVVAVIAVVFGLAASIAMGVLQMNAGLAAVFDVPSKSNPICLIILVLMGISFVASSTSGLGKGIKTLSNINLLVALVLLLFIIFLGPTLFIFQVFIDGLGDYVASLPEISFQLLPYQGLAKWTDDWTLTFFIWWVAFGPFVGVFIARISKGRTFREFMLGVVLLPTLFSVLWFAAFGGTALNVELFGQGGIGEVVFEGYAEALFGLFEHFPLTMVLDITSLFLIFIFLVTTADSGTFVVSMMTTNGVLNPPNLKKVLWGAIIVAISAATVFSGDVEVARACALVGAIPFTAILIFQICALILTLRKEENVPKSQRIKS